MSVLAFGRELPQNLLMWVLLPGIFLMAVVNGVVNGVFSGPSYYLMGFLALQSTCTYHNMVFVFL